MTTKVDEIAPRIYRLSTLVPRSDQPASRSTSSSSTTTNGTLLCGDLFTHFGDGPALTEDDILGPAEDAFGSTSLAPSMPATIRGHADLVPCTLAVMHGSSYTGDCAGMLHALADNYRDRITTAA